MDIAFTEDVIKNFHTEELGNDYRRDTYKLWADGSIELEESEYVDNFNECNAKVKRIGEKNEIYYLYSNGSLK